VPTTNRRVLFVSHDASRSGAPIVLLHFLRWFKANSEIPFDILLRSGGDLQSEFEALAPVWIVGTRPDWRPVPGALVAAARRPWILRRVAAREPGLVYSNTAINGDALRVLSAAGRPVVSHIHELESVIRASRASFEIVKRYTRRYIACSEAVRTNLVENHAIAAEAIDVVHEFIPARRQAADATPQPRGRILQELGIPEGSLIVGASGTIEWRKAPDLFVQLARTMRQQRRELPIHFIWVGGSRPGSWRLGKLRRDVLSMGMEQRVHFVGARPNPLDYFRAFDVFALVSREDPFPVVCLEAASAGTPIVCFDGAGGEKEFVEDDCGFVVPYLDVDAMASRTLSLLESAELRRRCGARAADKVNARHDVSIAAPKILKIIEDHL